ncbi:hypothetical protein [Serratia bockelmannii]|uniref:hypothetical protein n=1 Tax=Serratia bockelmannii TaxID=2703793 RepID=UPI00313EAB05
MIKRFNPDFSLSISHELAYMRETPEGGYVEHGDYATLFSELEALKAERDAQQKRADALAVENAAMREALGSIRIYSSDTLSGPSEYTLDMVEWLREGIRHIHGLSEINQQPLRGLDSDNAALAAIEARGVEKFAAWASEQESMARGAGDKKEARIYCQVEARAKHFAIKLREAK